MVARGDAFPGQGGNRPAQPAPPSRTGIPARPPISNEPAILGLSRLSRSRLGSRLFRWFFVCVFAVIFLQLVVTLLHP